MKKTREQRLEEKRIKEEMLALEEKKTSEKFMKCALKQARVAMAKDEVPIGAVIVKDGKVLGLIPLPIAGLMNDEPLDKMCEYVESVENAWKEMGCSMPSPFMTMALIPLACLPETRLTNRGLVDCRTFNFIDLIIE